MSAQQINWLPYLQILQGLAPSEAAVSGAISSAVQAEALTLTPLLQSAGATYDALAGSAQGSVSNALSTWASSTGQPAWVAADQAARLAYQLVCGASGPAAWQASTQYQQAIVGPPTVAASVVNGSGYVQVCTTAGVSGSSAPSWSTTVGQTTGDNGVVWKCAGKILSSPNTPVAFDPGLANVSSLNSEIALATEIASLAQRTDLTTTIGSGSAQWQSALQTRPSTASNDAALAIATQALQLLITQVQALQALASTFQ